MIPPQKKYNYFFLPSSERDSNILTKKEWLRLKMNTKGIQLDNQLLLEAGISIDNDVVQKQQLEAAIQHLWWPTFTRTEN